MDLKKVFLVGTAGFIIICLGLFYVLTNSIKSTSLIGQKQLNLVNVEKKLDVLEEAIMSHKDTMKELEKIALLDNHVDKTRDNVIDQPGGEGQGPDEEGADKATLSTCTSSVGMSHKAASDINMLDVYDGLNFDNPDGGVWKQGFDIKVDSSRFSDNDKLKVFVVPHSHNDPGWVKTFEKYFDEQTKHILDSMLESLSGNSTVKFIWAEISYFDLWWKDLTREQKTRVKKIVDNKQLEFVSGGWVMPDESSSHYYSILLQLTEGHQWLLNHLNYIPKNGWAIDPFGMSPTLAYFLRRTGLSNMLIQRTHYAVKKHLAKIQELEFNWRQLWDTSGSTDMFCHMMPFYSYDVPHTCGPNPKICCQFDFKRMRGVSNLNCPWGVPPQPIIARNVKERSMTLLDQYKKKAMLYKTNTLFVPLGDDFRWENKLEWDAQVNNYVKIFDYINSHPDLQAEVRFGTLDDYFRSIGMQIQDKKFTPSVLAGDFFTYADRDDHYWSGYFTSRPFHKSMDRELMGHLRAAQIMYSLMTAEWSKRKGEVAENAFFRSLLGKLISARRNLSLFQHHDGVAGTSKEHVMLDYAMKLFDGLRNCNDVMQQSLQVLTHLNDPNFEMEKISSESVFYESALAKENFNSLPRYSIIIIDRDISDRLVTVSNSVARLKTQLVTLYVSTYQISVVGIEGEAIDFEILPVFEDRTTLARNIFQLNFIAEMPPLGVKNYIVKFDSSVKSVQQPEIYVKNSPSKIMDIEKFRISYLDEDAPVSISNRYMSINFEKNGFAESVVLNGKTYPFNVGMFKYGAANRPETSGLYLFIPDGEAVPLSAVKPFVKVVKGKFISYVEVWLSQVKHRLTLYTHSGFERYSMEITNLVDIRNERNFELMMRFQTMINSGDTSYTDLNGFQMIQRRKFDKLPIQANYYPLPAATYIEDPELRMTILSRQPLGTASLASGDVEVMMDRRLMQDDNRGAGQTGTDNLETVNVFKVILEIPDCKDDESRLKAPMLSLASQITLHDMLHPLKAFISPDPLKPYTLSAISDYNPLERPAALPCDVELVDMNMLPKYRLPFEDSSYIPTPQAGVTVRRLGFDGRFLKNIPLAQCSIDESHLGRFTMKQLVGDLFKPGIKQMTLSFIHDGKSLVYNESILMKPMEIYAFRVNFRNFLDGSRT